jgi:hypothetical protein
MNVSRKLRIAGIVVAGLLVLYIVLGFFAVPGIVRSQAKSFVADTYDRELALGDVRFNPRHTTARCRTRTESRCSASPGSWSIST